MNGAADQGAARRTLPPEPRPGCRSARPTDDLQLGRDKTAGLAKTAPAGRSVSRSPRPGTALPIILGDPDAASHNGLLDHRRGAGW